MKKVREKHGMGIFCWQNQKMRKWENSRTMWLARGLELMEDKVMWAVQNWGGSRWENAKHFLFHAPPYLLCEIFAPDFKWSLFYPQASFLSCDVPTLLEPASCFLGQHWILVSFLWGQSSCSAVVLFFITSRLFTSNPFFLLHYW